ncbi:MAG: hypothetical protein WC465_04420 [Patescibacteria group bacterium]
MMWFDNNPAKKNLIIVLVFVFMIFIIWLWIRLNPYQLPTSPVVNNGQSTSTSSWDKLQETWQTIGDQMTKWQDAWQRLEKQRELLQAAREYVGKISSSTVSTTPTSTPTD